MNHEILAIEHASILKPTMREIKLTQRVEINSVIKTAVFPINIIANKVDALFEVFVGRKRNNTL